MDVEDLKDRNPHLREYLEQYMSRGGMEPTFVENLVNEMGGRKKISVIYPVGDPIFIHVFDLKDGSRIYSAIQPDLSDEEREKVDMIKERILELAPVEAKGMEIKDAIPFLFNLVTISSGGGSRFMDRFKTWKVPISKSESDRMLYHLERDLIYGGGYRTPHQGPVS